jgi:F0F1-type ATP synthase assembly protein I
VKDCAKNGDAKTGPGGNEEQEHGARSAFGAPLQLVGAVTAIGAGLGIVVGLLVGELTWGLIIGGAVGVVSGSIYDARRTFRH